MEEVRQNLWLFEAAVADIAVRGALIIGQQFAAVWDSLAHPKDVAILSADLTKKPFHLVYSHADWDHCWGTSGLVRPPATVIAHAECRRRFDSDVPETLARLQLAEMGRWGAVRLVPPNLTFRSRLN